MFQKCYSLEHPLIIFWLGLLTGALITSIVFLYGTYQSKNFQDALIRTQGLNYIQDAGD